MLYVFHGTDMAQSAHKAHALVNSLRSKKPDASFVRIEASSWNSSIIQEHGGGQGLFSNKYIILLDRISENAEAKEAFSDTASILHESTNIFIVLEGKLNADWKKACEKYAEKIVVSDEKVDVGGASKKSDFNIFALADALGSRDSFMTWSIYRQAVDAGLEAESIIGTLFWQVKSMILASTGKSAGETGLSPFVFSKAKKHAGNYSSAELYDLVKGLITVYHDSHRGLVDAESGLEVLLLKNRKG